MTPALLLYHLYRFLSSAPIISLSYFTNTKKKKTSSFLFSSELSLSLKYFNQPTPHPPSHRRSFYVRHNSPLVSSPLTIFLSYFSFNPPATAAPSTPYFSTQRHYCCILNDFNWLRFMRHQIREANSPNDILFCIDAEIFFHCSHLWKFHEKIIRTQRAGRPTKKRHLLKLEKMKI